VSRFQSSVASLVLAAAFVAVALGARGGTELGRTTNVELLLVGAGAAVLCLALLYAPGRRVHGAVTVYLFGALAAVTALSITWSIAPDLSFVEAGRTLAYLAVFAGAVAASHLAPPGASSTLTRALLLATVAVASYGLAARVWPGAIAESSFGGRIGLPYNYWNALGGTAAMGIVPALWLGVRREGSQLGRVLAAPALGILIATVLITQSRGALAAGAIACVLWLVLVPLRLRSLVLLAVATAGSAPVVAWALSKEPFLQGGRSLEGREAVAGDFGLLLLAMVLTLLVAGCAILAVQSRLRPTVRARNRAGLAVAVLIAVVPLVALGSVALSDRGLGGTVSDRVTELTSESTVPPIGGGRIGSVSSSRSTYWRQAWDAFEERPAVGLGAGSFEVARLAYRRNDLHAARAHGFLPQTLADLGLLGLAAVLALFAAWLVAAARATGLDPRRGAPRPPWSPERVARVAVALLVTAYGVQALLDWTWFTPGLTVMALAAAGYLAGRGPLARNGEPESAAEATLAIRGAEQPSPARIGLATAVAVVSLLGAWAIWQPERADNAVARSYELLDEGRLAEAGREAEAAHDRNPYSVDPLYAKAVVLTEQDRLVEALRALTQAVHIRPRDSDPWIRLATFQLDTLRAPERALPTAQQALRVDPHSEAAVVVRDRAQADIQQSQERRRRG
jgi:tetratricopeptide (TPR) repeat protein